MTTLIAVYDSESCVGRCDAKCYAAHESDCDCICGGRNHGVGQEQATENTADLVEPTHKLRDRMQEMGGDVVVFQPGLGL